MASKKTTAMAAAPPAPPQPASGPTRMERLKSNLATTPGKMTGFLVISICGLVIAALLTLNAYRGERQAVQTVGKDAVPSIVAAEHIRATLADANANVMNAFLTKEPVATGPSWKTYRAEMTEIQEQLLTAAQNITYGDEERKPILALMTNVGVYEHEIGKASAGTGDAMSHFLIADKSMRSIILPAAVELDKANFSHLDATYTSHRDVAWVEKLFAYVGLVVAAIILMVTQGVLLTKTHRVINLGYLAATAALIVFGIYSVATLSSVESKLISAKQDAFDSIHALWKARATAFDANADESLYLICHGDQDNQAKATSTFMAKATLISNVNSKDALAFARSGTKFGGYLGDELSNITFPGEAEAAMETLTAWVGYTDIDQKIRQLEHDGQHKEAVDLCIGTKPGQSDWQFDKFNEALGKTLDINQKAFDEKVGSAFTELNVFPYALFVWLVASVLLVVIGMKPRLEEYKF